MSKASILLILGGLLLVFGNKIPADPFEGISLESSEEIISTESSDIWKDLSIYVDNQSKGNAPRIPDTDFVCKMVDRLIDTNHITDDSRIDSLRERNRRITDSNRQEIVRMLQ